MDAADEGDAPIIIALARETPGGRSWVGLAQISKVFNVRKGVIKEQLRKLAPGCKRRMVDAGFIAGFR